MYRDGKQIITHDEHRFILNHGALGDAICSLPAIVHARLSTSRQVKLSAYVPPWQVELIAHLLKPYGEIDVRPLTEVPLGRKDRLEQWGEGVSTSLNSAAYNTHTRNRVHMVDYAFNYLLDSRPENMAQRSYPTLAPLGERKLDNDNYVVFPTGATSDNKLFKASLMKSLIEWVLERGYVPVLVGTKVSNTHAESGDGTLEKVVIRDEIDKLPPELVARCCDLREKTSLLELRDILGHAAAVVGIDGGTLHLAGTTGANIVYGMGTALPDHRYIPRFGSHNYKIKYVVPRDLECMGCQSRWPLTRWDFRFCAYGDNKCMDSFSPQDFINGLEELGL